jgi:hypothetical protein
MHRSTISNPRASWAFFEFAWSMHVSEAIFFAPMITCPTLSRTHQGIADTLTSKLLINKPTFNETYGLGRVAAVGGERKPT